MLSFFTKRILLLLATIPVVLFISSFLPLLSSNDPVSILMEDSDLTMDHRLYRNNYIRAAEKNKLNYPPFYLSITKSNFNKEYFFLSYPPEKKFCRRLLERNYSYSTIKTLYHNLHSVERNSLKLKEDEYRFLQLFETYDYSTLVKKWEELRLEASVDFASFTSFWDDVLASKKSSSSFIPKIIFHGGKNQFHQSLSQLLSGDLGRSLRDAQPVYKKLTRSFSVSFFMIICAMILVYPLGIFIGHQMTLNQDKTWVKILEILLYLAYSIPLFCLATLALVYLTTPIYGMKLFPSVSNYAFNPNQGFWKNIVVSGHQLILPILCIAFHSLASLSRQVKVILHQSANELFTLTARMKGLSNRGVLQHRSKNARPYILTMVSNGLTSAFAGSVLVEFIFNIPGMGRLLLTSIQYNDWPMLSAIILLLFVLTALIVMMTDYLYTFLDPRINIKDIA